MIPISLYHPDQFLYKALPILTSSSFARPAPNSLTPAFYLINSSPHFPPFVRLLRLLKLLFFFTAISLLHFCLINSVSYLRGGHTQHGTFLPLAQLKISLRNYKGTSLQTQSIVLTEMSQENDRNENVQ